MVAAAGVAALIAAALALWRKSATGNWMRNDEPSESAPLSVSL